MIDEDLEPLITRCPSCNTQFRVTENQLAAAGGRVRCGACLRVFEGTEHLILDSDGTFSDGSEADAALDALLDELVNSDRPSPAGEDDLREAMEPTEPVQLYGGFEDNPASDEETLSEEVIADPKPEADDPSIAVAPQPHTEAAVVQPDQDGSGDEPIADDGDSGAGVQDGAASDSAGSEAGVSSTVDFQTDYEAWIRPGIPNIDQLVDEVVASGKSPAGGADAEETRSDSELNISAVEKSLAEEGVGISPIRFGPEPRHWWVAGAAAVLVLALAAQIFYLKLPHWSRDPGMRGFYESACGFFGCALPEIRAVEAFRTRNLMVRSHPDLQNALVIDAVIVNGAEFPQRFPDLELRFTSVGGQLVAGRTFSPEEYLGGEARPEEAMPVNTPVQVSLEIADPGEDAVNYTLSFH